MFSPISTTDDRSTPGTAPAANAASRSSAWDMLSADNRRAESSCSKPASSTGCGPAENKTDAARGSEPSEELPPAPEAAANGPALSAFARKLGIAAASDTDGADRDLGAGTTADGNLDADPGTGVAAAAGEFNPAVGYGALPRESRWTWFGAGTLVGDAKRRMTRRPEFRCGAGTRRILPRQSTDMVVMCPNG